MAGVPWRCTLSAYRAKKRSTPASIVARQPVLDALAHHGALLARDGQHVGLVVGQDLLAEGDVEVLRAASRRAGGAHIAEFEVVDAELLRQAWASPPAGARPRHRSAATPP